MKYQVVHNNVFSFDQIVESCELLSKLSLVENDWQRISFRQLQVHPFGSIKNESLDAFGNKLTNILFKKQIHSLRISSIHNVITNQIEFDYSKSCIIQDAINLKQMDLKNYQEDSLLAIVNDSIKSYAMQSLTQNQTVYKVALDLTHRIYQDFKFDPYISTIQSTTIDCLNNRAGVCQDFSHFAVACLKSIGLTARYISGYVDTKLDDNKIYIPGKDVSHAWFGVYDPNLGWLEFDPTNNMLVEDRHIRMAFGKDYNDVCPLKGKVDSKGGNSLKVSVDVSKID
ncbi:transglutaminase domain-containing protein [Marinicellulosiphila megalodicopiae]|uniref:transglutaminase domain-containing protein n=1 Tax=Marinicellulosiphila megalodicopiae TaxID=2724896 RepID=UPI003BB08DE4